MAVYLEGVGDDWVVVRVPGRRPELRTYQSHEELVRLLRRELSRETHEPKARPEARPVPRPRKVVQQAPKKVNGRLPVAADLDCRSCGACCAPTDQGAGTYVHLDGGDEVPQEMRENGRMLTRKTPKGYRACVALEGEIGEGCGCSIYEARPMVCQAFLAGSEECLKARRAFGLVKAVV